MREFVADTQGYASCSTAPLGKELPDELAGHLKRHYTVVPMDSLPASAVKVCGFARSPIDSPAAQVRTTFTVRNFVDSARRYLALTERINANASLGTEATIGRAMERYHFYTIRYSLIATYNVCVCM
jgi:hypothetical protein